MIEPITPQETQPPAALPSSPDLPQPPQVPQAAEDSGVAKPKKPKIHKIKIRLTTPLVTLTETFVSGREYLWEAKEARRLIENELAVDVEKEASEYSGRTKSGSGRAQKIKSQVSAAAKKAEKTAQKEAKKKKAEPK